MIKSLVAALFVAFGTVSSVIAATDYHMVLTDMAVPYAGR